MKRMCGRFALQQNAAMLREWYETEVVRLPDFAPRYNIAPSSSVVAIRASETGRAATMMRWGLIPSWAKDPGALPMLHNARGETLTEKPLFRQAFRRRRCLIPASGFYEWKAVPGQRSKQPFYISFKDGSPMSFAGMWDRYRDAEGVLTESCTIVTTEANAVLEPIHHRMPLILDRPAWELWLSAEADEAALLRLVRPHDTEGMQVWGVSHAVNKVANDTAALVQPIA
jgi:putative SOS response-associated peptidase YedK